MSAAMWPSLARQQPLELGMKIIATVAMATLIAFGASPAAAQKITFTLNWVAGGDHAPYFYAQKMGWYKQAGLDVDFETGRSSASPTWPACCCSAARGSTRSAS